MGSSKKTVIGAVGYIASGKDHLLNYIGDNYNIPLVSIGDIVRDIAREHGETPDRKSLHKITRKLIVRFGADYFAKRAIQRIEGLRAETVGVSGVRSPADIEAFRERFGDRFILVHVKVDDIRVRYRRSRERREARDPQSFEEFTRLDRKDREILNIDEAITKADITIPNNEDLDTFHGLIDKELVENRLNTDSMK